MWGVIKFNRILKFNYEINIRNLNSDSSQHLNLFKKKIIFDSLENLIKKDCGRYYIRQYVPAQSGTNYAQNMAFVQSLGSIYLFDVLDTASVVHACAMVTKLEKESIVNESLMIVNKIDTAIFIHM